MKKEKRSAKNTGKNAEKNTGFAEEIDVKDQIITPPSSAIKEMFFSQAMRKALEAVERMGRRIKH